MGRSRFAALVVAAVAALALTGASAQEEFEKEALVPAALGVRNDGRGNTWNIERNGSIGRVGSTMVNSGLVLEVNGEKFVGYQPMMTRDGEEFVLQGRAIESIPGLRVQRRIRIVDSIGALRYAEMFYNGSADPVTINVALVTNFSGNYKSFLTDRGRTEPVLLEEEESGIVVLPGATQSTRAFLFSLATAGSDLKPTISARNRYALSFQYRLDLDPGETRIVIHEVAQVVIPQRFERRDLLELFRPYSLAEAVEDLPGSWSRRLANAGSSDEGRRMPGSIFPIPEVELDPGDLDLLVVGDGTRLPGEIRGSSLRLDTGYGRTEISLDRVRAIDSVGDDEGSQVRVHLRDGQTFAGTPTVTDFVFEPAGGGTIDLSPGQFEQVVLAGAGPGEGDPDGEDREGFLETHDGDRLLLESGGSEPLEVLTAWGRRTVTLEELVWFGPSAGGLVIGWVELEDGTRCHAAISQESVSLSTASFGPVSLAASEVRALYSSDLEEGRRWQGSRWGSDPGVGRFQLLGGQTLVARFSSPVATVRSGDAVIETEMSQVRRIAVRGLDAPGAPADAERGHHVEILRWDGGVVSGRPVDESLAVEVDGSRWLIPFRDIEVVETPSPELTEEVRERIGSRIGRLGSEEWSIREKASRELAAFGYLARPLLLEQLRKSSDPEVRRRIESILAGLN